jgi:hypothetical protein
MMKKMQDLLEKLTTFGLDIETLLIAIAFCSIVALLCTLLYQIAKRAGVVLIKAAEFFIIVVGFILIFLHFFGK